MIGEAIKKKGEKGSGGGREAFRPGVNYVCGKAQRVELRNLTSPDWRKAGEEMTLTSELSARVQKPYYHLVLSWHEHERPGLDQQFAAMHHLLKTLGLDDHQIVIGSHGDRNHCHIHTIVNTVHPITGKVWLKSNDHQKIEQACREVELAQGWTHDRGRFDFDVIEKDGQQTIRLKPAPEAWAAKQQARVEGKRKPSPGDIAFQKQNGYESFSQDIPPALRDLVAQMITISETWDALHRGLTGIGLQYQKVGSGARVHLIGSEEFARASVFGQAFSLKKLEARFGAFKLPKKQSGISSETPVEHRNSTSGIIQEEDQRRRKSRSFKLTLLRRIYIGLHLNDHVASQIHYVKLDEYPPVVTFKDRSYIADHGDKITASAVTAVTIKATVAMAKAKGWSALVPSGSPEYIRGIALEATRSGLPVSGVPADVQAMADETLEQTRKTQRRLDHAAAAALNDHLYRASVREDALDENRTEEARRAVAEIFGDDTPTASHTPGRPPVKSPQPSPDAAKTDQGGMRRIQRHLRENDRDEIDNMKHVDISIVAALGGWSDVSRTHPDSSDPEGKRYRIFQRGSDTIKASPVEGKWLWTSNKSGQSGSAIDLWQHDNPGKTLGQARTAFSEILGTAHLPVPDPGPAAEPRRVLERVDHTNARQRWEEAPHIGSVRSYAGIRSISRRTLQRFPDQVRAGAFGGVYFAHRNMETGDIQGFEQCWEKDGQKNWARFAAGGRKTVNIFGNMETATRMIVVESGLEALALAEIESRDDTIYTSTGGGFGRHTEDALQQLAVGREVLSGFDNDKGGAVHHAKLQGFLPGARRKTPPSRIKGSDMMCIDWLDVLNAAREVLRRDLAREPTQPRPEQPADDCNGPSFR